MASEFTDITLVCEDGRIPAHAALLTGLFSSFGITFGSMEDVPERLLLPGLPASVVERALENMYKGGGGEDLVLALKRPVVVKQELPDEEETSLKLHLKVDTKLEVYSDGDNDDCGRHSEDELILDEKIPENFKIKQSTDDEDDETYEPKPKKALTTKNRKGRPKGSLDEKKRRSKIFTCKKCGEKFNERIKYICHLKEFHDYETKAKVLTEVVTEDKCEYCDKMLKIKSMNSHMALIHREEVIANHSEIEFTSPCSSCDMMFFDCFDLDKHSLEVHGMSTRKHCCSICQVKFDTKSDLKGHQRKNHIDEIPSMKPNPCPYCEGKYNNYSMKKHIFNCHKENRHLHPDLEAKFSCNLCQEEFIDKASFRDHNNVNHSEKVNCPICSNEFANPNRLRFHMKEHKDQSYQCEECSKQFPSVAKLRNHRKLTHGPKKCAFPCPNCNFKKCQTELALQKHIFETHSGVEYFCSQCPKSFTNKNTRRAHEGSVHGEKTIKCDHCDQMFVKMCYMKAHEREVHLKMAKKICPHCGEGFIYNDQYVAHVNKHTNTRPFSCELCGKDFLSRQCLQKHMAKHTLPAACDQCDGKFPNKYLLKSHVKRDHLGIQVECRHGCDFKCPLLSNLYRHEKTCRLNPVPNAPYTVSNGTASKYVLETYHAKQNNN